MTTAATRFGLRELLLASRPVSWINTGLPFLAGAFAATRTLNPAVLLGTLYFLIPYNLLLYGVNDLFDYASDVNNPRKQSLEGGLVAPTHGRTLLAAILLTNVPLLAILAWIGGPTATIALAITVFVALIYSAPPLRTKERPFLDSATSAMHFVLPAVCGFLVGGLAFADLPWPVLIGFACWGVASHAIGAIQDIEYDRAAGIGSIATALGGRATALVSLVGYAIAVLAAATVPWPWNAIAVVALAPYLLLPVMVLARDDEAQARRAWRSFMQLNIPAGFLLTHVLLRAWGLTTYTPWELSIATAFGCSGWILLNTTLIAVATRRRAPAGVDTAPLPGLTIVVPCRDESARLPACLAGVVAQRYPGELRVLVVDDGSSDGSAVVAASALSALGDRARVIAAPPSHEGWSGKGWAVRAGVLAATTDLVLALDADTVLAPDGAARLAREQAAADADLVSGVSRYAMPTIGERATMPGYPMLLFGFVPVWLPAFTGGRPPALAFAYGPLELVRREAYLATDGHARVPGSGSEDVDLARTFAREGRRVHVTGAADIAATRHYATAREVLASWSRILPGYAGGSLVVALLLLAGEAFAFGLPLALPFVAAVAAPAWLPATLAPLALLVAARVVLAVSQRQPLTTIVLHPVTVVLTMAAQALATARLVLGQTPEWRGRSMPEAGPAAPAQSPSPAPGAPR